jgi:ubiquinone/menaquinone biosynthesis C-methylase UbiE/uncharacterized protein YbaR (Trm112 family)
MPTNVKPSRRSQIAAYTAASLFILGNFISSLGALTGPILPAWFVGTQKPRRGFLWMIAFAFVPGLIFGWRKIPLTGAVQALEYLGWALVAAVLGTLPFTFHRLVSPRLPGILATLPLPLAAVAIPSLALALHLGAASTAGPLSFLIFWFVATVVWLWNHESHVTDLVFAAGFIVAGGFSLLRHFGAFVLPVNLPLGAAFSWCCLGAALLLVLWALFHPIQLKPWASRPQTVAQLQSPFTREPLKLVNEQGREALASSSGERFPIRNGIPAFLKPEDLIGDNGKYNHLYETIGGFYDDTQRLFGAFRGVNLDSYFENYMSLLEVKTGDSVLETSVGTGLNFKYLPQGTKLSGLDLSPEMLANCQNNLRRWKMDADLYLGNAECLPFADSSFDVVFTCGGFNFFSDRAKAIREMIRVARPGGHLMIEDETEEYVKSTYENIPFTSSFYSDRKQAVTVPIDMVPPEMEDIHVEMLKDGKFYAITFRKPAAPPAVGPTAFDTKNSDAVAAISC